MKGGVEAPPKGHELEVRTSLTTTTTTSIVRNNTRTQDVGLLSSERPEPI
jgi:hypothetical protein